MKNSITKTRIIVLGSLTILTLVAWVGIETFGRLTTDRISPQLEKEITPLDPKLNLQILDQLSTRRNLPINFVRPDDSNDT